MNLKNLTEALIFAAGRPLGAGEILTILESAPERIPGKRPEVEEALECLEREWAEREGVLHLVRVAEGFEFRTQPAAAPWVALLNPVKPHKLSRRAFETLALVAYRQPITRVEIENLRGVDSAALLKNLLEKDLIRVVGRKEEAGRPLLYATTKTFLELFGLKDLNDLPPLSELEERAKNLPVEAPDESLVLADLAMSAEDLSGLEEADREVLGELEEKLQDLRQTEKETLEQAAEFQAAEQSLEEEGEPPLDKEVSSA